MRKSFGSREEELFSYRKQDGTLKISVSDTGCGMSQESMNKLFKMFGQVHEDASKRKIGTGLGLFITKELCVKMKGKINMDGEIGLQSERKLNNRAGFQQLDIGDTKNLYIALPPISCHQRA